MDLPLMGRNEIFSKKTNKHTRTRDIMYYIPSDYYNLSCRLYCVKLKNLFDGAKIIENNIGYKIMKIVVYLGVEIFDYFDVVCTQ